MATSKARANFLVVAAFDLAEVGLAHARVVGQRLKPQATVRTPRAHRVGTFHHGVSHGGRARHAIVCCNRRCVCGCVCGCILGVFDGLAHHLPQIGPDHIADDPGAAATCRQTAPDAQAAQHLAAFAASWLAHGFALSEDLLLSTAEFFPHEKDTAVGEVIDARPDRWGERAIRFIDKPPRLWLLEYLLFRRRRALQGLGRLALTRPYELRCMGLLPTRADTAAIHKLVRKVLANQPIAPAQKRLISPGATLGGARPKALLDIKGERWVVKFSEREPTDRPLIKHATKTLARAAAIRTAETMLIRSVDVHALAIKRFDRAGAARVHALSANVALKAAGELMRYPELSQLLRQRGIVAGNVNVAQMRELFRRIVFNILIDNTDNTDITDNTDDHEKNYVLLVDEARRCELSPAFDMLPSEQARGYQQASGKSSPLRLCAWFYRRPAIWLTADTIIATTRRCFSEHAA